jgi:hypothetical protein
MELKPQILHARVMHKRLLPVENAFTYGVYYLAVPLPESPLPTACFRFPAGDLGARDGSSLHAWVRGLLDAHGLAARCTDIMAITMPKVMGYVFNPVSFYLCLDTSRSLRAVISEVHNTFGEQHVYLAMRPDRRAIGPEDWLEAEKQFHVSPFLPRSGAYRFRFNIKNQKIGIWIDYLDAEGGTQLLTSLTGRLEPLSRAALWKAFFTYPLVTLKTVALIHLQALRLMRKGIRYITKPPQKDARLSLTKM